MNIRRPHTPLTEGVPIVLPIVLDLDSQSLQKHNEFLSPYPYKFHKIKKLNEKKNNKKWYPVEERKNIMSKRYSGKSLKDSSTMKKSKLSFSEKRKIKREKKKKR